MLASRSLKWALPWEETKVALFFKIPPASKSVTNVCHSHGRRGNKRLFVSLSRDNRVLRPRRGICSFYLKTSQGQGESSVCNELTRQEWGLESLPPPPLSKAHLGWWKRDWQPFSQLTGQPPGIISEPWTSWETLSHSNKIIGTWEKTASIAFSPLYMCVQAFAHTHMNTIKNIIGK